MRSRRRATLAVATTVAVLVGGCSEPDPATELRDAVRATEATSVTFTVAAVADRGALEALEGGAAEAAAFLEGAGLVGARDPDGALRLAVTLGGEQPLLEVVSVPDQPLLLRTGLPELLGVSTGADPAEQLEPALEALGVDEAGRRALAVSFAGGWLALRDVGDVDQAIAELLGGDDRPEAPPLSTDLATLFERVEVRGVRDAGDVRRFDVVVDTAATGGATGSAPVPGTVVTRDGLLQEVRVELPGDAEAGVVELVLTLTPVGSGTAVLRPEPDAELTAAQLLDLVEKLQGRVAVP